MRLNLNVALFALGAFAVSGSALGQTAAAPAPAGAAAAPLCQKDISKKARPALVNLQTAVNAKNSAAIPGLISAAQAVAVSSDEKCSLARLQLKAALDAKDMKGAAAAVEAQLATGALPTSAIADLFDSLADLNYDAGAYAEAEANLQRSIKLAPGRAAPMILLAETRVKQNRAADALPLLRSAIAAEVAAGRKPPENWYKRPVAIAYEARNPATHEFLRSWLTAYPSAKNWRDAIKVHAQLSGLGNTALLDMYRLGRLTRSLSGEADFAKYADASLARGLPGEAKGVLEEGFAAGTAKRELASLKAAHAAASAKFGGDRASLDQRAKEAATAKAMINVAEAYYTYGDYAKAATLLRAVQAKGGADAELANLRLGMALAASGDKAGAKAALSLVTGSHAEIARYWLTYVSLLA